MASTRSSSSAPARTRRDPHRVHRKYRVSKAGTSAAPTPPNSKSAVQPLASSTVTPADNSTVSPSDAHPGLLLEWMEDQQQRFHNYLQHKPPEVHALEHRRLISLYNQLAQQLIIRFPAHQLPSVHLLLQSFKLIIEASNALMAQSTHCTDSTEVGPETPLLPLV